MPVRVEVDISNGLPAFTIVGRTMVPLRFIIESLGANVQWDEASQTILIGTTGAAQAPPSPTYVQGTIESSCQMVCKSLTRRPFALMSS